MLRESLTAFTGHHEPNTSVRLAAIAANQTLEVQYRMTALGSEDAGHLSMLNGYFQPGTDIAIPPDRSAAEAVNHHTIPSWSIAFSLPYKVILLRH
jgi:hypothetical protein